MTNLLALARDVQAAVEPEVVRDEEMYERAAAQVDSVRTLLARDAEEGLLVRAAIEADRELRAVAERVTTEAVQEKTAEARAYLRDVALGGLRL